MSQEEEMGQGDNRTFVTALEGGVQMTPIEGAMLDHPYVQQLRGQRTFPGLQFAFPDASHTRFSQALGSCGLATRFFEALVRNADAEMRAGRGRPVPREREFVCSDAFGNVSDSRMLRQAIRFTALFLHAGQGPWGGIGPFAPTGEDVVGWLRPAPLLLSTREDPLHHHAVREVEIGGGRKRLARVYAPPLRLLGPLALSVGKEVDARAARGERLSWAGLRAGAVFAAVAADVFRMHGMLECGWKVHPDEARDRGLEGGTYPMAIRLDDEVGPSEMAAAFLIAAAAIMELSDLEGCPAPVRAWAPFVRDIVVGAPVGADGVTSLMRDHRACGVSYGSVRVEELLRALLPVVENGRVRVAWRRSGVGAVERVILEAMGMARHVHGAKGSDAAERMMRRTLEAWEPVSPRILDLGTLPAYLAFLEGFGRDDAFLALLAGHMSVAGRMSHPPFTDIPRRLGLRRLYQSVATFRDIDEAQGERCARLVHEAASVRGWKGSVFAVSVGAAATSSLFEDPARVLAPDREGFLRMLYPPGWKWASVTGILAAAACEPPFVRIYADPDDGISLLPREARDAAMDAYHGFMDVGSPRPSARLADAVGPAPAPLEPDDALPPASEPDDTGGQ